MNTTVELTHSLLDRKMCAFITQNALKVSSDIITFKQPTQMQYVLPLFSVHMNLATFSMLLMTLLTVADL